MNDVRNQIEATVLKMNDMLRQLANIEDYEYRAGTAAQVAGGAFANMGDQASNAVSGLNDFANGLHNVADGVRDLKSAMDQPTSDDNNVTYGSDPYGASGTTGIYKDGKLVAITSTPKQQRAAIDASIASRNNLQRKLNNEYNGMPSNVRRLLGLSTGGYTGA